MGRRALLADVREHLASSRVVTLVGPGGVGKTRVALRFAEVARRTYRDGCWVVPLADLAEPGLLGPAVAEALGLQGADGPWQVETLADHIADRTALLVLDNCEHLLAAVGDLVEGLRATCPNLRFLLTSRRPLRLSGEDVIVVPPLSLPDEATVATPEAITHYEAVNLFLDRAMSARSDFELTPDNAAAVVTLCRELDGLPLAIELAAARIRALSPQEIRDSLAERLEVLNLGYRDADDRHQSLRACVEWSYDLCTELEQRFWARSSVFTGGYDLEAAAAVCACRRPARRGGPRPDERTRRPVDRPRRGSRPGHTRYRMLADIRQFGLERAEKDGELHGMRERHATWCAELVSRFDDDACGPHQPDWLRRLRPGAREPAGRHRVRTQGPPRRRGRSGHGDEARPVLVGLRVARRGPPLAGGRVGLRCRDAAGASPRDGRGRPVRGPPERPSPRQAADRRGDRGGRRRRGHPGARVCCWCPPPCCRSGTAPRPRLPIRPTRAVALLRAASDLPGELLALFVAGVCHGFAGNSAEAAARHRQCIARADEVGERHMKALAVAGLGEHELAAGRLDEATALFREAIVLKQELGDRMGMAVGLDSLGRVATAEGRGERAALLLGAAESIWDAVGMSETGNPFAFAPSRSDGLQQARKLLGKQRFRELFRRGSQLGLDEAVPFALEAKTDAATTSRARRAVPADQAGDGGGRPGRRRAVQPRDRRTAGHLRADRPGTRGEHPAQARVQLPVPHRGLGHRTPARRRCDWGRWLRSSHQRASRIRRRRPGSGPVAQPQGHLVSRRAQSALLNHRWLSSELGLGAPSSATADLTPRLAAWASRKTSCCARSRSATSASCGCGSPTCSGP